MSQPGHGNITQILETIKELQIKVNGMDKKIENILTSVTGKNCDCNISQAEMLKEIKSYIDSKPSSQGGNYSYPDYSYLEYAPGVPKESWLPRNTPNDSIVLKEKENR